MSPPSPRVTSSTRITIDIRAACGSNRVARAARRAIVRGDRYAVTRERSRRESDRTVRGDGAGTASATHLGPVTLIPGREGELILPATLLLLLRGRLHHPERGRTGRGGQRGGSG